MLQLGKHDKDWAVKRLPKTLAKTLSTRGDYDKFVVAGGFLRSTIAKEPVSDIDIFTDTKDRAESLANELTPKSQPYCTDNAVSVTLDGKLIQIIYRWPFPHAEAVVKHFDFTVCQAALYFTASGWASLRGDEFYEDLAAKRLVYTYPDNASAEPGGSMLRMLKYRAKGYHPTLGTIAGIVGRIAERCTSSAFEIGVLAQLREVDPLLAVIGEPAEKAKAVEPELDGGDSAYTSEGVA